MTTDALLAFVSLIGILMIFYGPWQATCTDFARQIIFEQRDKLFDIAKDGRLDFFSDEYRSIRLGIESIIRFAHELTLPRLIYMSFFVRKYTFDDSNNIIAAIAEIKDDNTRDEVVTIIDRTFTAIIFMMIFKSLICVVLLPVILIAIVISKNVGAIAIERRNYIMETGKLILLEAECG
ncbi:MAG: hypothetical protein ACLPN5_16760 [Roseiarcus sp.]